LLQTCLFITIISFTYIVSCSNYTPTSNDIAKKYDYYFKAIVTEDTMRSMNESDRELIDGQLTIIEDELSAFMTRNFRAECYDLSSKSAMAAEIMVNGNISQAMYTLAEKDVLIQFSFHEMLYDNIKLNNGQDKTIKSNKYIVYEFKNNSTNQERAWENKEISVREVSNVNMTDTNTTDTDIENNQIELSLPMEDSNLAVEFETELYQNLETKQGVEVNGNEDTNVISLDNGVEITVEYETISNTEKGLVKKIKKAAHKVKHSVSNAWDKYGPQIYGTLCIISGVVILAEYYGAAFMAGITSGFAAIPLIYGAHPFATAIGTGLITSGCVSIIKNKYYIGFSYSYK